MTQDEKLDIVINNMRKNFFVAQIGTIKKIYDTQYVDVELAVVALINNKEINFPLLVKLPYIVIQGGGASLTFPIKNNDDCLVIFNDTNIDHWIEKGAKDVPYNGRDHDLADGIVLVGLNSKEAMPKNSNKVTLTSTNGFILDGGISPQIGGAAGSIIINPSFLGWGLAYGMPVADPIVTYGAKMSGQVSYSPSISATVNVIDDNTKPIVTKSLGSLTDVMQALIDLVELLATTPTINGAGSTTTINPLIMTKANEILARITPLTAEV